MLTDYSKISFLNHPFAMLNFAMGKKDDLHEIILIRTAKAMLGTKFNSKEAKIYLEEIRNKDFEKTNEAAGEKIAGNRPEHLFGKFIYFIVRCAKPEVMLETGVSHGVSSWNILNAMNKNGTGKLYSIDLPDLDYLKTFNVQNFKKQPGWIVPDSLRNRWELQLGDAKELLPALIKRLGKVDIFFHDSDHSYDFMTFEFTTAYPALATGGLLISDDVHVNNSFVDFVRAKNMKGIRFNAKGGVALKK